MRNLESALGYMQAQSRRRTHKQMGTEVSHFFAGVYCAPMSICSHKVRSSYAPPVDILQSASGTFIRRLVNSRSFKWNAGDVVEHDK